MIEHILRKIRNVVENAVKYSASGPEIAIKSYNADRKISIAISDKGVGMGKEYHRKIFQKYFRINKGDIQNTRGFGLGLFYVKKIVQLHGGIIKVESALGSGTTITITLPND